MIYKLIEDEFLIILSNGHEIHDCEFKVNIKPYHPKEVLICLFQDSFNPIAFDIIKSINNEKYIEHIELLKQSIHELLEENIIYEVSDDVYAYIRE